eukprot:scaffold41787_cov55-Phaeocystis_antarctica.AAC.1
MVLQPLAHGVAASTHMVLQPLLYTELQCPSEHTSTRAAGLSSCRPLAAAAATAGNSPTAAVAAAAAAGGCGRVR